METSSGAKETLQLLPMVTDCTEHLLGGLRNPRYERMLRLCVSWDLGATKEMNWKDPTTYSMPVTWFPGRPELDESWHS